MQDQDNPRFVHKIFYDENNFVYTTSTHHQAQYPWMMKPDEFKVIAWTKGLCKRHFSEADGQEMVDYAASPAQGKEVEIAFYPQIKALAIQGHPELMWPMRHKDSAIAESICYHQDLLDKLIGGKL